MTQANKKCATAASLFNVPGNKLLSITDLFNAKTLSHGLSSKAYLQPNIYNADIQGQRHNAVIAPYGF